MESTDIGGEGGGEWALILKKMLKMSPPEFFQGYNKRLIIHYLQLATCCWVLMSYLPAREALV